MADHLVSAAVVSLAAEVLERPSAASTWIKLAPRGRIETRDGRTFSFDPETLAARFSKDGVHIPIDFEHGIAKLASKGQRSDAIGWIEEMEARPDGLYGRVEWLDVGKAALAAKTHRYVSPTFPHDKGGNATFIHSVALVNAPALAQMPAVAHLEKPEDGDDAMLLAKLRTALALPEDASEDEVIDKIGNMQKATLAMIESSGSVMDLLAELSTEKHQARTRRAEEKVDAAIKAGSFLPRLRDWALGCAHLKFGLVSPIWGDEDVEEFIAVGLRNGPPKEVFWDCMEKYGDERTPSLSSIKRFASRLASAEDHLMGLRRPLKGFQRG